MKNERGFTLIELSVVLVTMSILLGFAAISLVRSQQTASLTSAEDVLLTNLKQQQLQSMIGDAQGGILNSYGVHFDANRYVLFHGNSYSSVDSANVAVNLDSGMQFNSPGFDVIFATISGELSSSKIIDLQNTSNSSLKRIHLNIYGVTTQVESL